MTNHEFSIPERFRGPPRSGNGGYVAGVLGRMLRSGDAASERAASTTLRAPVPLDRPLQASREADTLVVRDGERLIAEASWVDLELAIPEPASWEEALAVREHSAALRVGQHRMLGGERIGFHPICFCCGAELQADEGLRVHAAPVPGRAQVAAAWVCEASFADASGSVPEEIISTALDCPGQFAWLAEGTLTGLLGRLSVRILHAPRAGEPCVVIGWTIGSEGRKYYAGTALFDAQRRLCAYAKAVWIGRV